MARLGVWSLLGLALIFGNSFSIRTHANATLLLSLERRKSNQSSTTGYHRPWYYCTVLQSLFIVVRRMSKIVLTKMLCLEALRPPSLFRFIHCELNGAASSCESVYAVPPLTHRPCPGTEPTVRKLWACCVYSRTPGALRRQLDEKDTIPLRGVT